MAQTPRIPTTITVPDVTAAFAALARLLRANAELAELEEVMRLRNACVLDCFG
jgi:hypothetical protein